MVTACGDSDSLHLTERKWTLESTACVPPYMGFDSEPELVRRCHIDSLELDDNLSWLPCQIAHVPVAVKVRNQPGHRQKRRSTIFPIKKNPNTSRHRHLKELTWLSALRHLCAGRTGPHSSWPIQCVRWRSSSRQPQCSSPAPFPAENCHFQVWFWRWVWCLHRIKTLPHDIGGHTFHSRIHTSTTLPPGTQDTIR